MAVKTISVSERIGSDAVRHITKLRGEVLSVVQRTYPAANWVMPHVMLVNGEKVRVNFTPRFNWMTNKIKVSGGVSDFSILSVPKRWPAMKNGLPNIEKMAENIISEVKAIKNRRASSKSEDIEHGIRDKVIKRLRMRIGDVVGGEEMASEHSVDLSKYQDNKDQYTFDLELNDLTAAQVEMLIQVMRTKAFMNAPILSFSKRKGST